ncbi:MAG: hypothetical protein R3F31_21755 [Verrucomicrobiales bacterium]
MIFRWARCLLECESGGVFLGVAGRQAWFLSGAQVTRVTLGEEGTDRIRTFSLDSIASGKQVEAVLAGSRLYAAGVGGVRVLNALGGGAIQEIVWPAAVTDYLRTGPCRKSREFLPVCLAGSGPEPTGQAHTI